MSKERDKEKILKKEKSDNSLTSAILVNRDRSKNKVVDDICLVFPALFFISD
jgi:hypothetical protein